MPATAAAGPLTSIRRTHAGPRRSLLFAPGAACALLLAPLLLHAASCTTLRERTAADATADSASPFQPGGGGFPGAQDGGMAGSDVDLPRGPADVVDPGDLGPATCTADCDGRQCGPDGCGGLCGSCPLGHMCLPTGACTAEGGGVCQPDCSGKACGSDGCGGLCGVCPGGLACLPDAKCGDPSLCTPSCVGKQCGPDGCDGLCGDCAEGLGCSATGQCGGGSCAPSCADKICGSDGCGGLCGVCPTGSSCADGQCKSGGCAATCTNKSCGDDGCGGLCGVCPQGSKCLDAGQCICVPNCVGIQCGDDGCGGLCGVCPQGTQCGAGGQCACATVAAEKSGPSCDNAFLVGSLPDTGTTLALDGVIATQDEVDWIRILAIDNPDDKSCDQFHMRVRFSSNPGGALTLVVFRDGCGSAAQVCDGTSNFEWMTDFMDGDKGECPCTVKDNDTDKGVHLCKDNSAAFTVGVRHAPGVVGGCTPYSLEVTNGVY